MSKKRKQDKQKAKRQRQQTRTRRAQAETSSEPQAGLASKVAWMLCAIATLFGSLAGLVLWLALQSWSEVSPQTALLPQVLLFAARLSGLIALLLTPIVYWAPGEKPPKLVTCGVLLIAALPWLLFLTLPAPG